VICRAKAPQEQCDQNRVALERRANRAGNNMSNQAYRLTAIHQWVDQAIEHELQQEALHDPLRLMRLRAVRLAVKKRLRLLTTSALALA
jgi:hypothetical protein